MAESSTTGVGPATLADTQDVVEVAEQAAIHDRVMDAYFGKMGEQFMRKTQNRVHWVCESVRGNNILDVGCSQGIVPILLAREGKRAVGLDTDEEAINVAREYVQAGPGHVADYIEFVVADFVNKDWGDRRFDTVVMTEVLEHLVDPGAFVDRAAELLVPGGRLVVTVPFGINDFIDHKRTYYLVDVYCLLLTRFEIEQVELFGKWIGFRANLRDRTLSSSDVGAIPLPLLCRTEAAFQQIERELLEATKTQRVQINVLNDRIGALGQKLEESRQQRKARLAAQEKEHQAEVGRQHDRIVELEQKLEESRQQQKARLAAQEKEHQAEVGRQHDRIVELEQELGSTHPRLADVEGRLAESTRQLTRVRGELSQLEVKLLQAEGRAAMASPTAMRLQRMQRGYEEEVAQQYVRTQAAEARLEFARTTLSAQLGAILTYACRSPKDFVKTPVRLARLLRALFARDEHGRLPHVFVPDLPHPVPGAVRVSGGKLKAVKAASTKAVEPASHILTLGWPVPQIDGKPLVMAVMDEFTRGCFEGDLSLLLPRPDNWRALAEEYSPELYFVESAWKGNDATWQYRVADYATKPGNEVADMLFHAAAHDIPGIFWNKEDPVHHKKFMGTAKKADYIFTTDANMIGSYKEKTGNPNVHALPFAAQPALHRPAPLSGRIDNACFAGTWYGDRHQQRGEDMRWLLSAALPHGLTIFDRNFGTGNFEYPREYRGSIKGGLPYKELCEEYRNYRLFLNVNSVTESPTMFSRRVFELMASGTPVVSAYARGIEEMFGNNAVWLVRDRDEAEEAIRTLMSDDKAWRRRSLLGIRKVFAGHTYGHRLNTIFEVVGAERRIAVQPKVLLLGRADGEGELERLVEAARAQTYGAHKLRVEVGFREPGKLDAGDVHIEVVSSLKDTNGHMNVHFDDDTKADAVGWLSSEDAYGPAYIRDLANAMLYRPEAVGWGKSSGDDRFAFGQPTRGSGSLWRPGAFASRVRPEMVRAEVAADDLFVIDGAEYATDDRIVETLG